MEINLNASARKVLPEVAPPTPPRGRGRSEPAPTEFRATAALERALETRPEVRPEVVAEAKTLIGQPTYPPRETIRQIASLLALKLGS